MKLSGLYRKTDSKIWYFQPPQVRGIRPPPISLGTKDEQEAVAAYWRIKKQANHELAGGRMKLEIERYLKTQRQGRKHDGQTTRETERILSRLLDFVGQHDLRHYTPASLAQWQRNLESRGLEASTLRTYVGRASGFFSWCVAEKLIRENPVTGLVVPTTVKTRADRYCTREERDRLVANCLRDDLALFFWLGFFAGLRPKEIIEARPDWLDLEANILTVQNTPTFTVKAKRHRRIRLSPRLREFLAGQEFTGSYLLRPDKKFGKKRRSRKYQAGRYRWDPKRPFLKYVAEQKLDWVRPHMLRHTFATLHALAGTPLATIAAELGDDLKVVTEHYIGYTKSNDHSAAID